MARCNSGASDQDMRLGQAVPSLVAAIVNQRTSGPCFGVWRHNSTVLLTAYVVAVLVSGGDRCPHA